DCRASQCPRNRLGAGRAGEHGRAVLRPASPGAHRAGQKSARALGEALRQRRPGHRLLESARTRTKNPAHLGLLDHNESLAFLLACYSLPEFSMANPLLDRSTLKQLIFLIGGMLLNVTLSFVVPQFPRRSIFEPMEPTADSQAPLLIRILF